MGEKKMDELRLQFDPHIQLEFHPAKVTSDAGLLAYRELDDALGLTDMASDFLKETRTGRNIQHQQVALLRQSVYSRLAGYEDINDAQRLRIDPAMRTVVSRRAIDKQAASTNTVARFETEMLTFQENLDGLKSLNEAWLEVAMSKSKSKSKKEPNGRRIILDMDSSESPVYGHQEASAYNGHFESRCYHPLFCFNQYGDCEGATLRPGNVHSADGWRQLLEPVVAKYKKKGIQKYFRGDAAFANPEVYEYLEGESFLYAIRLPTNDVLLREIAHLLKRPVGRPPKKTMVLYHDFMYQAVSWNKPRRVVAKVEWHCDELLPRVGFIVTNLKKKAKKAKSVIDFYNGRGTAEGWIKACVELSRNKGKYALNWTRLSCHEFVANCVRLHLFILAYNLGNFLRRLALPRAIKHWSLRSLKEKLM